VTSGRPPRPILVDALKKVHHIGKALDIGAGALNETKYLLAQGFEVTAIDNEPRVAQAAKALNGAKLNFQPLSYQDFKFPNNHYDLVAALYALPFTPPKYFKKVVNSALGSVKPGGVFVGQLFGKEDEWNDGKTNINFVSKDGLINFFKNYDILSLDEEKGDGTTATGGRKFWHTFHIIAKKHS
jgi:tellurite methyltransferase